MLTFFDEIEVKTLNLSLKRFFVSRFLITEGENPNVKSETRNFGLGRQKPFRSLKLFQNSFIYIFSVKTRFKVIARDTVGSFKFNTNGHMSSHKAENRKNRTRTMSAINI